MCYAPPVTGRACTSGCDLLAVTGGHRVDLDAFGAMLSAISAERGWRWAHANQPAAQSWLAPPRRWDAILLHDLVGLDLARGRPPRPAGPSTEVVASLRALLEAGQGLVVLHHAMASWPNWDGWADAIGARFLYAPGSLRGVDWPSSGTCLERYLARPVSPAHPVCEGVEPFELDDELYLCPVFEDEVEPLVRAAAPMDPERFKSSYEQVLVGEARAPTCTGHAAGSDLIVWATSAAQSPIVVIQPGDSASTFSVPAYRRLLGNALAWVASVEAHAWARARTGSFNVTSGVPS